MTVSRIKLRLFGLSATGLGCFALIATLAVMTACQKRSEKGGEESAVATTELSGKNGGFRILPTMAARDTQRPRVIYRCNDVPCGEAFQPSNEERDMFFACSLSSSYGSQARIPPYMRVVKVQGEQKLIQKKEHLEACASAKPFEKVLAEPELPVVAALEGGEAKPQTCRQFRSNKEACASKYAQGCRWVTHPSGRASATPEGDCIGLLRVLTSSGNMENVDSLQLTTQSLQWVPLESYRSLGQKSDLAPK